MCVFVCVCLCVCGWVEVSYQCMYYVSVTVFYLSGGRGVVAYFRTS